MNRLFKILIITIFLFFNSTITIKSSHADCLGSDLEKDTKRIEKCFHSADAKGRMDRLKEELCKGIEEKKYDLEYAREAYKGNLIYETLCKDGKFYSECWKKLDRKHDEIKAEAYHLFCMRVKNNRKHRKVVKYVNQFNVDVFSLYWEKK